MRALFEDAMTLARALTKPVPKYDVSGAFTLEFTSADVEPDIVALRLAILVADHQFPWHGCNGLGEEGRSIRYLSDGRVGVDKWRVPVKSCSFNIHPEYAMHKGQLHAYEKYLDKIAEELALRNLPDVREVRAVIKINGVGKTFHSRRR